MTVEPEALEKLVTDGYSLAYGARFLKRVIDDRIKLPLSQHWKEANAFRVHAARRQDRGRGGRTAPRGGVRMRTRSPCKANLRAILTSSSGRARFSPGLFLLRLLVLVRNAPAGESILLLQHPQSALRHVLAVGGRRVHLRAHSCLVAVDQLRELLLQPAHEVVAAFHLRGTSHCSRRTARRDRRSPSPSARAVPAST